MASMYDLHDLPTGELALPGLPERTPVAAAIIRGEASWTVPGIYDFTVPIGVTSICAVCIGGGGGMYNTNPYYTGGGGSLGWANNLPVSPGQVIRVVVGVAGVNGAPGVVTKGGDSFISPDGGVTAYVNAPGGNILNNANIAPTPNGNVGGANASTQGGGGGGAGGYTSQGGKGGDTSTWVGLTSLDGGSGGSYNNYNGGGAGGGSWLYGSIIRNSPAPPPVTSGSTGGNADGSPPTRPNLNFNLFWGGGAGYWPAGSGAVRILWGAGRAFPATDVGLPI
ncbi:hypothetical protein PS723_00009 [Pseudomonas fluorescens]|uniref:Glycine-rich domain-containing protein n=1 Tax=Pseudomonas fluorescens TaxID=294 RepID=A0A5E6ZKH0_PSEFL|nr:hypothetical protein PS723_00009 [Pseudomonas fluorescens]